MFVKISFLPCERRHNRWGQRGDEAGGGHSVLMRVARVEQVCQHPTPFFGTPNQTLGTVAPPVPHKLSANVLDKGLPVVLGEPWETEGASERLLQLAQL